MFKLISHKLPLSLKGLILFLSILSGIYYIGYYLYRHVPTIISKEYSVTIDVNQIINQLSIKPLMGIIVAILLLFILFLIDIICCSKRINEKIQESLEERQLNNFPHFYKNITFDQLIFNLEEVFSLYKSLDNMKTSRIVLEVATMRQLMNNVSEGLILVSKNLIVTHINHVAEEQLGLIPGESNGQALSRKISHDNLLDSIEKVFEYNQKVLNISLKETNVSVSIFPLRDKFGEVMRALVILKKHTTTILSHKSKEKKEEFP